MPRPGQKTKQCIFKKRKQGTGDRHEFVFGPTGQTDVSPGQRPDRILTNSATRSLNSVAKPRKLYFTSFKIVSTGTHILKTICGSAYNVAARSSSGVDFFSCESFVRRGRD